MIRRIGLTLMLVLMVAVALAGCSGEPEEPAKAPAPTNTTAAAAPADTATPAPPTNTPEPAPTNTLVVKPTEKPTEKPADTATPEQKKQEEKEEGEPAAAPKWSASQLFSQPDIDSYRSNISFSVSGPAFEEESDLAFVITGEYTRDPEAQRLIINAGDEVFMEMVQIGEKQWVNYAGMWMETTSEETGDITEEMMLIDMEDIGDLNQFEKVGTETINGFKTTQYHFEEDDLLKVLKDTEELTELEALESAEGDVWVTKDGVVVKWVMHFEGVGINEQNAGARGAMDISYELYDINAKDIDIQPPASQSSEETLGFAMPVPDGATQTMAMAGMITYDAVDTTIEDLTEFYKKAFADLGFIEDADAGMTSEDFSMLSFSDGSTTVSITIMAGENGAIQIMVMTEAAE